MSDQSGAPAGSTAAPANDTSPLTLEDARNMIFAEEPAAESAEPEKAATAEPESSKEDAAPAKEPGEDAPDADAQEEPEPVEPPRSWTKAEKERFSSLPRETQEYLHTREQERERDFRRSQNDIAEQRKAIETERGKAEALRKQYEAQLPALMAELQNAQQNTFSDIKNMDDVTKLANDDPFRYLQWQAHQTKLQAVNAENERARTNKVQASQAEWTSYVQKQNELAAEYIPELADKVKGPALMNRVGERMKELGFKQDELNGFVSGEKISPFDYRFQRLLANDLKLADIQSAPKAVAAKPLPPVQKPGVSRPAGAADSEHIQALEKRLNQTGSIRDAEALLNARMTAANRRAS